MHWVCYMEVQGLYAEAARKAGLVPAGKPVVVLRDGKVFDGCREAFSGGLTLEAPARQALRDAPQAARVEWSEISCESHAHAWWDRCLQHTPYIEPGEPHQVFLAIPSPVASLTTELKAEINRLADVAAEYGFVAFTGAAPSKLVARAAALACKEGWLLRRPGTAGRAAPPAKTAFVLPGEEERYLAPLPIRFLPAPPDVQRRLARLGLKSIGEAARIPEGEWLCQLGPLGRKVTEWCHGIDPETVKPCYPLRTIARRTDLQGEVRDRDLLEQSTGRAAAVLAGRLIAHGEGCQQVTLTLERSDGPPLQAIRMLAKLQQAVYPLQQALQLLLSEALAQAPPPGGAENPGAAAGWDGGVPVTALTVELGLIGPMPWQQLNLWDDVARSEREERLERALSLLHERFPARVVGLGPRQSRSWREQMLQFVDPYRWANGEKTAHGGGSA